MKPLLKIISTILIMHLFSGCATTLKNNASTTINAQDDKLSILFDETYPFKNVFSNGLYLRAFYSINGVATDEKIGLGRRVGDQFYFKLPNTLSNIPDDQVCLQFEPTTLQYQNKNQITAIPIRNYEPNIDTAGFRYPEWETYIKKYVKRDILEKEILDLEKNLKELESQSQSQSQSLSCSPVENTNSKGSENTMVISPNNIGAESIKYCLNRAQNTMRIFYQQTKQSGFKSSDTCLSGLESKLKSMLSNQTYVNYQNLNKDCSANINKLKGYTPILNGSYKDLLPVVMLGDQGELEHFKNEKDAVRSFYGKYIDLYSTCKSDTVAQLQKIYEDRQKRGQRQTEEEKQLKEYRQAKCEKVTFEKDLVSKEIIKIKQEIESKKEKLAILPKSDESKGLISSQRVLNQNQCSPY